MSFEKLVLKLMCFSRNTFYVWKREERPIISLIEKYFSNEDIKEFLETGKIQKFENIEFVTNNYMLKNQSFYINSFQTSQSLLSIPNTHDEFKDFYFNFLGNFGKINFPFNVDILGIQSLLTNFLYQYQMQKIKEKLTPTKISEELKNRKSEIDNAIEDCEGKEKEELKEFKKNFKEETQKEEIIKDIFYYNQKYLEDIMLHFFTFNTWNNDMYYFLELVKKDDFDYFINSKNDELLYQAIGYLIYINKLSKELKTEIKLYFIELTFHYFIFNKNLISSTNIKEHIVKRLKSPESFSGIDKEIAHKYITSPFPTNNKTNMNSIEDNEVVE